MHLSKISIVSRLIVILFSLISINDWSISDISDAWRPAAN